MYGVSVEGVGNYVEVWKEFGGDMEKCGWVWREVWKVY